MNGWKLVPVELTPEMSVAGVFAASQMDRGTGVGPMDEKRRAIYRAQITAAPTPEVEPDAWRTPGMDLHHENPEGYPDWTPLFTRPAISVPPVPQPVPPPPTPSDEPVAVVDMYHGVGGVVWGNEGIPTEGTKLYTHPAPSDELRKVVLDVCSIMDTHRDQHHDLLAARLREALDRVKP